MLKLMSPTYNLIMFHPKKKQDNWKSRALISSQTFRIKSLRFRISKKKESIQKWHQHDRKQVSK